MMVRILAVIVLIVSMIYSMSYAKWTWSQKNRLGALAIAMIGIMSFFIPMYFLFIREG